MGRRQRKFLDWNASNPRATHAPPGEAFSGLRLSFLQMRRIMLPRTKIVHHASELHKVQAI
jgi:hypothetical protein